MHILVVTKVITLTLIWVLYNICSLQFPYPAEFELVLFDWLGIRNPEHREKKKKKFHSLLCRFFLQRETTLSALLAAGWTLGIFG